MSEKRTIGEILSSLGRISQADIETALAYQKEHGGYFGEALIACGLVSGEELEWGLATQFDLPYVFPEVDAVDLAAAALVSPEWAQKHVALPILRTEATLQVVIDSPMKQDVVDELARETGLVIELSLAPSSSIRQLIREVFGRAAAADDHALEPSELTPVLGEVIRSRPERLGISGRGDKAVLWWAADGAVHRCRLLGDWVAALGDAIEPAAPADAVERSVLDWDVRLEAPGCALDARASRLADESGVEYVFLPAGDPEVSSPTFRTAPSGIIEEVAGLVHDGRARFVVTSEPARLGPEILPHLPRLLLDEHWRSIYINSEGRAVADVVFSVEIGSDRTTWPERLDSLKAFHFDAVSADLAGADTAAVEATLDLAPVAFLLGGGDDESRLANESGVHWRLHVEEDPRGFLDWTLELLNP